MKILAYHFITSPKDDYSVPVLNRPFKINQNSIEIIDLPIFVGQELEVCGPPKVAEWGLHASQDALSALYCAPDLLLTKVECSGDFDFAYSLLSFACTKRKVLKITNARPLIAEWLKYIVEFLVCNNLIEEDINFKKISEDYLTNLKSDFGKTFSEYKKSKFAMISKVIESYVDCCNSFTGIKFDNFKIALKTFLHQNPDFNQTKLDFAKNKLEEIFNET